MLTWYHLDIQKVWAIDHQEGGNLDLVANHLSVRRLGFELQDVNEMPRRVDLSRRQKPGDKL